MNADAFAGFWSAQGYKLIRTESCCWYDTEPYVYLSLPFHRIISPGRKEISKVFREGPAFVVRYATPADDSECNGGLYVCDDVSYDIASLSEKPKNRTRRALRNCEVRRIEFNQLKTWGHEINRQTYIRQERDPASLSYEKWEAYCDNAEKTDGFEAWGAFVEGTPAAYVICALIEDYYHLLRQSSATEFLSLCPNNALTFTVTQQAVQRSDVKYVSTGLKSVEDTGGLDRYKEGMGYRLIPFRDELAMNPMLRMFVNMGGAKVIRKLHTRNPGSDFWRKAVKLLDSA